jgi:hypothetical protein
MRPQSTPHLACAIALGVFAGGADAQSSASEAQDFRAVYQQIVEINSSHSGGGTTKVAALVRERLLTAGFAADEVTLMEPFPGKGNRWRASRAAGTSGRCCSWRISTWSKRSATTGRPTPSSSRNATASSRHGVDR